MTWRKNRHQFHCEHYILAPSYSKTSTTLIQKSINFPWKLNPNHNFCNRLFRWTVYVIQFISRKGRSYQLQKIFEKNSTRKSFTAAPSNLFDYFVFKLLSKPKVNTISKTERKDKNSLMILDLRMIRYAELKKS